MTRDLTRRALLSPVCRAGLRQAERQGADAGGGDPAEGEDPAAVQAGGEVGGRPPHGAAEHPPGQRRAGQASETGSGTPSKCFCFAWKE